MLMTFITMTTVISIMKLKSQNHWKQQPKVVPLQQQQQPPPPQQQLPLQPLQLQPPQPPLLQQLQGEFVIYHKVVSFNTSCLEAHAGFFRLLMKGNLYPYVL